jgi:hypothetical protein
VRLLPSRPIPDRPSRTGARLLRRSCPTAALQFSCKKGITRNLRRLLVGKTPGLTVYFSTSAFQLVSNSARSQG